jgi:hypothetical protein
MTSKINDLTATSPHGSNLNSIEQILGLASDPNIDFVYGLHHGVHLFWSVPFTTCSSYSVLSSVSSDLRSRVPQSKQ